MSETVKINLKNVLIVLTIVIMFAGLVGSAYIAIDNAKTAKEGTEKLAIQLSESNSKAELRFNQLEVKQARFEGKLDERTANTQADVKDIKRSMELLLNNLKLAPNQEE